MSHKLLFSILIATIFSCLFITAFDTPPSNNPPTVKIIRPLNNSTFDWNALVNYNINVSDKEDGNSEYNEIPVNEVVLKVVYLSVAAKVEKYLSGKTNIADLESPGLSLITTSGCFNCHSAKNKLIGPSFELIARRYPNNTNSVETLSKKVIHGSTRVWGEIPMPPQPNLKTEQSKEIIRWILKNSTNPDVTYYVGTEGAFRTKARPGKDAGKGAYVLIASYTDHGLKDMSLPGKRGQHSVKLIN